LGGALSDYGINDAFMKELAANIKPGNAALFVLIRHMTADKVLREIQDAGGPSCTRNGCAASPNTACCKKRQFQYDIEKGWYDPHEQQRVWPGSLIRCRCFSKPVIPGLK